MRGRIEVFFLAVLVLLVSSELLADGLQYPLSAVADKSGKEIFIADLNQPGVWKLADGKLSVFFQASKKFRTPLNRCRCVAFDQNGKLLAGCTSTREVYRFDDAGQPQPLTKGGIGIPMDLAVDPDGNIFVADLELHWIWKIAHGADKAEKFAEVPAPRGIAIDADRNLWIVSHGKNQVVRLTREGKLETVVEGRPFSEKSPSFPHEIELAPDKTAYVSDGYNKTIWKIPPGGKPEKWISGDPLKNPVGLTWQGNTLLVIDPHAKAVFAADAEGKLRAITP